MTNKPELTRGRTIGSRIATLLAADSVPLSDAWKVLIDAADAGQAELQERRNADSAEPVYQYRIRNGYNGQVTEWQTIRRDQVDFVLKAQPLNAEFRIISAPLKAVAVESPLTVSERAELHAFRRAACNHGFPPGAHTQGVVGCEKCCGRRVMIWELGGDRDHTHQIPGLKQEEITPGMALHLGVNPTKLAKIRDTDPAQLVWQLVIDEGGEISWELDDGTRMILKAEKVASAVANAGGES